MHRTASCAAGGYSRATVAQQQISQFTLQHRSTSVLASLMRMRSQFQRLRNIHQQQVISAVLTRSNKHRLLGAKEAPVLVSSSLSVENETGDGMFEAEQGSSVGGISSSLQAGVLLCTEAQRLLKGEARSKDPLSDVAVSSPLYSVEAGKLLTTAAAFGASTTYPRVQEVCAWIRDNTGTLRTPRQIMSLCTPLLNLTDGATAGVSFVLDVLYEPLLLALQEVNQGDGSGDSICDAAPPPHELQTSSSLTSMVPSGEDPTGGSSAASTEQQLVAITSAFGMVAKWSAAFLARATDVVDGAAAVVPLKEERAKMQRIAEASVAALTRFTSEREGGGGMSHDMVYAALQQLAVSDVVVWLQCLHGVERAYTRVATEPAEREEALRRVSVCYRVLLPLMRQTLDTTRVPTTAAGSGVGTAGPRGDDAANTDAPAAGINTPSTTHLRVTDVADLVQAGLFTSVESEHTTLALRQGLQTLPNALSAATVRDVCLVTQLVNKVRMQRPAELPATLVHSIMAALRPRLFLLHESQAYQLRPQDCSTLISQLSRWEEMPGVTVNADVVEMLSQRFGEQMPTVEAMHLVPFVQAVARLEEHRRPTDKRKGGTSVPETGDVNAAERSSAEDVTLVVSARRRLREKKSVRYFYSSTTRVVAQCAQRTVMLATGEGLNSRSSNGGPLPSSSSSPPPLPITDADAKLSAPRLSPADAGLLISGFVQLSSPQLAHVFTKVEPLLTSSVIDGGTPATVSEPQVRVAVQEAVTRFIAFMAETHPGEAGTSPVERQAKALLSKMKRTLLSVVSSTQRPKDLVMVASLVRQQLLGTRSARDIDTDDDLSLHRRSLDGLSMAAPWRRADVRLATCFAKQVRGAAAACNGRELGLLSIFVGTLARAGVLPPSVSRRTMLTLSARCASGLEAAAATGSGVDTITLSPPASPPIVLTVDDCKKLMDGVRTTLSALPEPDPAMMPPVGLLGTFAALCNDLAASVVAKEATAANGTGEMIHGTARSYAMALADLRRHTTLGRSIVSCYAACSALLLADGGTASEVTSAQLFELEAMQGAWRSLVEAYLELLRAVMASYAAEAALSKSWWAEAGNDGDTTVSHQLPSVPLEVLGVTAHVAAQLQRLVHRHAVSAKRKVGGVEDLTGEGEDLTTLTAVPAEAAAVEPNDDASALGELDEGVDEGVEWSPDTRLSLAVIDEAVSEVLGMLGDTIALLARQLQQPSSDALLSGNEELSVLVATDADKATPAATQTGGGGGMWRATMNPKHLLMLLQAFEAAHYRHPEMLYGILPELRSCADQLDPLELSLLIRVLSQLGAWNSRLLQVLATAVDAKMQVCELRQCQTLLRGLCRSGCVSADTFVELRGTVYSDWTHAGTRRGDVLQEPLQQLAESALRRLDALVCTKNTFSNLAKTATLADLVNVVTTLRFFHVPPPPTYDAFVVLAIRKLVSVHTKLPERGVLRHSMSLLDAVTQLRQPAQQSVSAQTVWAVVQRALTPAHRRSPSVGDAVGDAGDDGGMLPLSTCWQLWQLACRHTLLYGSGVTRVLWESPRRDSAKGCVTLFTSLQARLERLVSVYVWGPAPTVDGHHLSRGSPVQGVEADAREGVAALSPAGQVSLRRYGSYAAPSLVRYDAELSEPLCFPLRLARRITEHQRDLSALVKTPLLTAPAAQAKKYVRLAACLLRRDLWESNSIDAEAQLLLVTALQALWEHSDLHHLLQTSPGVFTTEELVVLAAAAAHLQQSHRASSGGDATAAPYRDDCVCALRQLDDAKAEWGLAAAVDVWTLFARFVGPPAAPQLRFFPDFSNVTELFSVLAKSGEALVAAFAQIQTASLLSRTRVVLELLRLFQASDEACISSFLGTGGDAEQSKQLSRGASDAAAEEGGEAEFKQRYAELQECVVLCLENRLKG